MNKENINRLKKYLFLISMFFSIVLWSHIIYIYLYDDSNETPIEWGSISEWIIWEFPHLNPLITSTDYNKNINYLLYRSLLKYDYANNEIISDLAQCDIKNISKITCFLKNDILWSNGEALTIDDVIATYNILKNSDINNSMWALIKDTVIEKKENSIVFQSKVKDINFIMALFQPIVSKSILDNIGNKELYWKFNPLDGLYSGPYKVDTVSYDDSLGIQKLMLTKNEFYKEKDILVSKYTYKFFKDKAHLLKHKDVINVFFDKNKIIADSIPRLWVHQYFLNQYNAVFINEERVKNTDLRNFILSKIDTDVLIKNLWNLYSPVESVFLNPKNILTYDTSNSNLESIMKAWWYFRKDDLASNISQKTETPTTNKIVTNTKLQYIWWPITQKYSFLNTDNILLEWKTNEKKPTAIYINDYKLSSYKAWETTFYYRLKTDFKNILPWENTYNVYFQINGRKELVETFTITYSSNKEKLEKLKSEFEATLNTTPNTESSSQLNTNSPEILSLEENAFYDINKNKFTLRLYYIENKEELIWVVNIIKNILESYYIKVDALPISISDLNKKIQAEEKDYDMLILWLDLWYFKWNLYPYFHSSQAKLWFNFSNIKNLNLDILLEEAKSTLLNPEDLNTLEEKINTILKERLSVKPLYQQSNMILIDNNIRQFELPNHIANELAIYDSLLNTYVSSDKNINFWEKWISDFITFIKKVFTNE